MKRSASRAESRAPGLDAPYAANQIVPLQKTHRVLLPGGGTPDFCRELVAIALSGSEFVRAARDYPIVFAKAGAGVAPVAVLGFEAGTNLFVDAAGEWDPACYLPAFVQRFPFCVVGGRRVCVVKSYVDKAGVALYDKAGKPTPRWQEIETLVTRYEADLQRTALFCTALARLQLLEPFSASVKEHGVRAGGMERVSVARLRALAPVQLKALVEKGWLGLIYAHLHSLSSFDRLAARLKARKAAGKGSPPSRRSRPR